MSIVPSSQAGIASAAQAIAEGNVVAYPTETVYGLGVDPFSEPALDRLFAVKARDPERPVLLVVADSEQLERLVLEVTPRAQAFIDAFWPGPLSLVLAQRETLPRAVSYQGRVCVRCPACAIARDLCRAVGGPITSTSANRSGASPARTAEEASLPGVAVAIDGGPLPDIPPSTVLDLDTGRILRAGTISRNQLEPVAARAGLSLQ